MVLDKSRAAVAAPSHLLMKGCAALSLSICLSATSSALGNCEWAEGVGIDLPEDRTPLINSFADDGQTIYATGIVNNDDEVGALKWNGQGWTPLIGGTDHLRPRIVGVHQGDVYVGGEFHIDEGRFRIGRWNDDQGIWEPASEVVESFQGTGNTADKLISFDGALYIGGRHSGNEFMGPAEFGRYAGDGEWEEVPHQPAFAPVRDMIVHDDSLYVSFGTFPGSVYRFDEHDGEWTKIGGDVPSISRLAVFQGDLHVAGTVLFPLFEPSFPDPVMRLVGNQWEPIPGQMEARAGGSVAIASLVSVQHSTGEALYVNGNIRSVDGVTVSTIARWDGSSWSDLQGGVDFVDPPDEWDTPRGWDLHSWNGALWVGGEFNTVGMTADEPVASLAIARWNCSDILVDADASEIHAASAAISTFGGETLITVIPRDAAGTDLGSGLDVQLSIDAGGTLLGDVTFDDFYRQTLQASTDPAQATVTATVNGVTLTHAATVSFVPVHPEVSTIDLSVDQVYTGGTATITVTPRDDEDIPVGSGFDVAITSSAGELFGSVTDHGDGTYSQDIALEAAGTASITATVNDMPLNAVASLTALDPEQIGNVVSVDAQGNTSGHLSIQAAIDAATPGSTVFIAAGSYSETLLVDDASGVIIEGLSAFDPVSLQGIVFSNSNNISLRYLTFDPANANQPRNAIELRGGNRASSGIEVLGSTITNARANGILIDRDNAEFTIIDSTITGNGRNGIEFRRAGGEHLITNSTVSDNDWNGIKLDRDVFITIQFNEIAGNGAGHNNPHPHGHGISRQRQGGNGSPEDVTLIHNTLVANNGRPQNNRSDSNIRNYDQIIDATDDQPPYTD